MEQTLCATYSFKTLEYLMRYILQFAATCWCCFL